VQLTEFSALVCGVRRNLNICTVSFRQIDQMLRRLKR